MIGNIIVVLLGMVKRPIEARGFYTGRMLESDAFGRFKSTSEYEAAFRALKEKRGFVSREQLFDLVRRFTKEDPTNPNQPFARELRLAVLEQLGIEDESEMDRVRFYSAVGTPVDVYEGVDAWVEYQDEEAGRIIVTLDVTKNPNKDEWKADVIIPEVADESDEERFVADAEKYATEVVRKLQDELSAQDKKAA